MDFRVMRVTHASIGHRLKVDPKVTADQRGHRVGVAIEEYTKTSLKGQDGCGQEVGRIRVGEKEGRQNASAKGILTETECNGMQVFRVSLTC